MIEAPVHVVAYFLYRIVVERPELGIVMLNMHVVLVFGHFFAAEYPSIQRLHRIFWTGVPSSHRRL